MAQKQVRCVRIPEDIAVYFCVLCSIVLCEYERSTQEDGVCIGPGVVISELGDVVHGESSWVPCCDIVSY